MAIIKYAVCWDECGNESYVECDANETSSSVMDRYPEYKFRYFKEEDMKTSTTIKIKIAIIMIMTLIMGGIKQ